MKLLFLLSLMLLPGVLFSQTTVNYYVSDSGDDENAGTESSPFRSIQHCVDQFDDVTQVICNCEGTFNEEISVTSGGPSPTLRSKIIAWDTDGDGSREDETFVIDGEGTRNQALSAILPDRPDNVEIGWATFRNFDPDGGCNSTSDGDLHFILLKCWSSGGCADWWIHDNVFEKLGKDCGVAQDYIAIQPSNAPNLIVENNRFDSIGGFIMRYVGGTGIKFRNNHVIVTGTGIKAWDNPDSIEIVGNVFECDGNGANRLGDSSCGGQHAVHLSNNVTASQIRDNIFLDCVTAISLGTSTSAGTRSNGPHLIEGNRIYQTAAVCKRYVPAIEINDCSDVTLSGDSVRVFDVTVRNNIIAWTDSTRENLGAAIKMSAGHPFPFENNVRILNNTVSGFGRGVQMDICYSGGAPFPYQLRGVEVVNNVFRNITTEFFTLSRDISTWPDSARELNWTSNYNTFSGRDRITWGGVRYTLAEWSAAQGHDAGSQIGVPEFVSEEDSARPLFLLSATDNLARNRGVQQGAVLTDINGLPRPMGGDWDIGAHEVRDKRIAYVHATLGSDDNFGTAAHPFRTLQTALNVWNGSDQFELRGAGSFSEELTVREGGPGADSMNTIVRWDTDRDGDLDDEVFVLDGGDSLAIALATDTTTSPDYVRISGLTFRDYRPGQCNQDVESRFIRLKGRTEDRVQGWRVDGNIFTGLAKDCITDGCQSGIKTAYADDVVIRQNRFDSIGGFVLRSARSQGIEFRENDVKLIGYGVRACEGVDSITIAENVFIGDGNGENSGPWCRREWGVELVNGVQYGVVTGNTFYGSSGGVLLQTNGQGRRNNAHHVIEKNRVYLNDAACNPRRAGIQIADGGGVSDQGDSIWVEDVLIRNNVVAFSGERDSSKAAIKLRGGHPYPHENDIRLYHNTIVGFYQGILVQGSGDETGTAYEYQLNGVKVKNNLFAEIGDAQLKFESSVYESSLPESWESDYNVYGGTDRFRWQGWKDLRRWQRRTGQDVHSVVCDVEFVTGGTVYHLSSNDVCAVETGEELSEVGEDIDGESRPNGTAVDAGADERTTGTLSKRYARSDQGGAGDRVTVYPHPVRSSGRLVLRLTDDASVTIRLYNNRGELVREIPGTVAYSAGVHDLELKLEDVASGLYTVEMESGGQVDRIRIVVAK